MLQRQGAPGFTAWLSVVPMGVPKTQMDGAKLPKSPPLSFVSLPKRQQMLATDFRMNHSFAKDHTNTHTPAVYSKFS